MLFGIADLTLVLDLHLLETVLPESEVGGDTVLTVVENSKPVQDIVSMRASST
jgi:hypothetical protein